MVDTPYGDCFAVLTKWVFEPLPTASASAASSSAAAAAAAAAASSSNGGGGGGGGGSSSSAAIAGGGCSVSVSTELVRPSTRALWLHLLWLSLPWLYSLRLYWLGVVQGHVAQEADRDEHHRRAE